MVYSQKMNLTNFGPRFFKFGVSFNLLADRLHYKNKIVGSRAIGMGGAFGGIADDPSGLYYNPAGLGFAIYNSVSANASASSTKKTVYKEIMKDLDFEENSDLFTPNYFGGIQNFGDLKVGFLVTVPDAEYIEQNDKINTSTLNFVRTYLAKNTLTYYGLGAGYPLNDKLSLGFSLFFYDRQMRTASFQYTETITKQNDKEVKTVNTQNVKEELVHRGWIPKFGVQFWPAERISLGLSIDMGILPSIDNNRTKTQATGSGYNETAKTKEGKDTGKNSMLMSFKNTKPAFELGEHVPLHVNLGTAWFVNSRLIMSLDGDYYAPTKEKDDYKADFNAEQVINFSFGCEYFMMPNLATSAGFFSNYTNTPVIDKKEKGQNEHIDLYGYSVGLAWVQGSSSINFGFTHQFGDGEAQKTGSGVQDVTISQMDFSLAGSYSF